ncbi:MAG TPA: DUF433 domain-containing protein [Thermoanaerobaculia bacterium]
MISRAESFRLLYGGMAPEEKPRYSITRAAHYLHISRSTLRSWVRGRDYPKKTGIEHWPALIKAESLLSFNNLIEAYVLRALRVDHGLRMAAVREALEYAQMEFGISRLLLSAELQATPGNVFLERFGQLINLNRSGQLAAKHLLHAVLQRVRRNPEGLPDRMFPVASYDINALRHSPQLILIDPEVSFGRPIVASKGVRTAVITGRIDAGEDPQDVAQDYGLEPEELEAAISYERAAA